MKKPMMFIAAAVVLTIVMALACFSRVSEGEQAVWVRGDGSTRHFGPGIHLHAPFAGRLFAYPLGLVERRFPAEGAYEVLAKDGAAARVAMRFRVEVPAGAAADIYRVLGEDFDRILKSAVSDAIEIQMAEWAGGEGRGMPPEYANGVLRELRDVLAPAGVNVLGARPEVWKIAAPIPHITVAPAPLRKVVFVGVDGADWAIINALIADGRLANFKKIIDGGASGPLKSIEPLLSPLIWTTIATGRLPEDHGILNFTVADPETGNRVPVSRLNRKVDAVWNMLGDYDRSVDVVGWLATFPAETIHGVMVTDRVGYLAYATAERDDESPGRVSPAERASEVLGLVIHGEAVSYEEFEPFVHIPRDVFLRNRALAFDPQNPINDMIMLYASTKSYVDVATHLLAADRPDFLAVYFELVDATGHLFMHYAPPMLPGIDAENYAKYKDAVTAAYVYQDQIIGKILELCDERTVLIVASDHGFKSGESRPRSSPEISEGNAAFWHLANGIVCLYGSGIRAGQRIEGASILDLAPTFLALQGLPKPDDMPGNILESAFSDDLARKLNRSPVATLQRERDDDLSGDVDDPAMAEVLKKLQALNYISQENPDAYNNLGQRYQAEGRYVEAIVEFKKALAINPSFPSALNNLGVCYGKLKNYEAADDAFRRALAINPKDVYAMNNLAIMNLELGRFPNARKFAEQSVHVEPNYANGHLTLGSVYATIGEFDRAEQEFLKVLEIDPSSQRAQLNLQRVRSARSKN